MTSSRKTATPPRVLVAGLFHETNTFIPERMGVNDFEISRGAAVLESAGNGSPLGAALEEAARLGWEVVPAVDIRAMPGAAGETGILDIFFQEIEKASAALDSPLDAIFLVLHGAMVIEGHPDVEGDVLGYLRGHAKLGGLPVFGVLDLHANFTPAMADHSTALLAYRENPHADAAETAVRAARLLQESIDRGLALRTCFVGTDIVWPAPGTGTASDPMKTLNAVARSEEHGGIYAINVFGGFAHADTPCTGVSFSIVFDPEKIENNRLKILSNRLRQAVDENKHLGLPEEWDLSAALEDAIAKGRYPVCLVEPADNIGGGAPGDGTTILRALLEKKIINAGVILNDPEAVAILASASIGRKCDLQVGGKGYVGDPGPVFLQVKLLGRSDGVFDLEDRQSHLASICGTRIEMGPCAVIESAGVTILLTSRRTAPMDLGQWRSQGVEPSALSFIGVKAAVAHRRAYDPIARASYWVRTPGPCASDLSSLSYQLIRRPVFPLDPV